MNYGDLTWEEALEESHKTLLKNGPRSSKKLVPPHQWIKETLKKNLGSGYEYYAANDSNGPYDKEYQVPGLFYPKMVDITVVKGGQVKGAVSFKFVASNYSQNSNNYFENLVGECFNIQAMDIPFCHVFVIRDKIPYYKRDRTVQKRMFKRVVTPLNYNEHLKLKYDYSNINLGNSLVSLILNGEEQNAIKYENEMNRDLINNIKYNFNDWDEYLKYGGFPILARKINFRRLSTNIVDMIEKVVNTDMVAIKNFTFENQTNSNRILRYLALQNAGDLSQNNLAKYLKTSQANVKNILDILEKTHLIFSIEAYGTSSKRMKKTKKYYFATSSIRNALSENSGNIINDIKQYEGILLENHVASILFNFTQRGNDCFTLYYDANKKRNVDFILQRDFKNPVPIEVGRGRKDKKQITHAINSYGADYGIIISDTTTNIEKHNNIIYVPPKTFSFL